MMGGGPIETTSLLRPPGSPEPGKRGLRRKVCGGPDFNLKEERQFKFTKNGATEPTIKEKDNDQAQQHD